MTLLRSRNRSRQDTDTDNDTEVDDSPNNDLAYVSPLAAADCPPDFEGGPNIVTAGVTTQPKQNETGDVANARAQPQQHLLAHAKAQPQPDSTKAYAITSAQPPKPDDPPTNMPASRSPDDMWRVRMLEEIQRLSESESIAWGKPTLKAALNLINKDNPDDHSRDPEIKALLDAHADEVLRPPSGQTTRRPPRPASPTPGDGPVSKRKQRRVEYATIQKLFESDKRRCAQVVLNGHWRYPSLTAAPAVSKMQQEVFWAQLFNQPSKSDERPVVPVRDPQWVMMDPVTVKEVDTCLRDMSMDSAAGPDKLTVRQLRSCPRETLAMLFNLWLYVSYVPEALKHARTTLIPKTPDASTPEKFRPITVSSVRVRLFMKILARRASNYCRLNPVQRAFIPSDGVAENAWLLDSIMQESRQKLQPLAVAWIDVAKAFDSVSHHSICRAATRIGMPPPIVDVIRGMYDGSTTEIRKGFRIRTTRGVRQGDPLSPHLFNAVVDEAVSALGDSPDGKPTVMAFADDLVVLARTPAMLQYRLQILTDALSQSGLSISPTKCQVSVVKTDGRHKRIYVDATEQVLVNGKALPNIGAQGEIKYLGLMFDHGGIVPATGDKVLKQLAELKQAPLKPEQRLFLLRTNVLPGALHTLVLGKSRKTMLKRLDQSIRRHVRQWLHLPPDAPDAYIHAHVRDGGLGIPELQTRIPLLRTQRASNILTSEYGPVKALAETPFIRKLLHASAPVSRGGRLLASKAAIRQQMRDKLLLMVDGRGLESASNVPCVNDWVNSPKPPLRGSHFVGAIKVRGNLLLTGQRTARQTGNNLATCDAGCGRPETLAHISQVCHRTAGPRTDRHNRVLDLTARFLADRGATTLIKEPAISTPAGLRKPDLLVKIRGEATVLDAQVVADNADLDAAHQRKRDYYDKPVIRQYVGHSLDADPESVQFGSITLNWRGAWSAKSADHLKRLGLRARELELLSIRALEGTHRIWKIHRDSTATTSRGRRDRMTAQARRVMGGGQVRPRRNQPRRL